MENRPVAIPTINVGKGNQFYVILSEVERGIKLLQRKAPTLWSGQACLPPKRKSVEIFFACPSTSLSMSFDFAQDDKRLRSG